ncbi:hypothetical protein CPB84DRAFT_1682066 [Gymnopilus junonius]|uniref:Reverse transcriptase zinc-binding domain-containing protein n=1 Tax=Gymnopilus junonius TaxID=109634 RepID=A0A9P5NLK2_GYMJU|nr:hypothetical protein CPB84DRAFT_1682066 [Gymnopilus junonius]
MQQSAETGELAAIKIAAERTLAKEEIHIEIKSKQLFGLLTKKKAYLENQGYMGIKDKKLLQATIACLRKKRKRIKVKYTPKNEQNNRQSKAKKLADEGALNPIPDIINTEIDIQLKITGVKLNTLTQASAYKMIREKEMEKYQERRQTKINLDLIKMTTKETFGKSPSTSMIWKSIKHKDISKNIRYFLWMAIHDAYMIGNNWEKPGFKSEFQQRSSCTNCNVTETMEHILTKCKASGQKEI